MRILFSLELVCVRGAIGACSATSACPTGSAPLVAPAMSPTSASVLKTSRTQTKCATGRSSMVRKCKEVNKIVRMSNMTSPRKAPSLRSFLSAPTPASSTQNIPKSTLPARRYLSAGKISVIPQMAVSALLFPVGIISAYFHRWSKTGECEDRTEDCYGVSGFYIILSNLFNDASCKYESNLQAPRSGACLRADLQTTPTASTPSK